MSKSTAKCKAAAQKNPYATPALHVTAPHIAPAPASTSITSSRDLRAGR